MIPEIKHNKERKRIEIVFKEKKIDEKIRDFFKERKFRYSRKFNCWYGRYSKNMLTRMKKYFKELEKPAKIKVEDSELQAVIKEHSKKQTIEDLADLANEARGFDRGKFMDIYDKVEEYDSQSIIDDIFIGKYSMDEFLYVTELLVQNNFIDADPIPDMVKDIDKSLIDYEEGKPPSIEPDKPSDPVEPDGMALLKLFIPASQWSVRNQEKSLQENQDRLIEQVKKLPKIYGTEGTKTAEIVAYLHLFYGSIDLYVTEFQAMDIVEGKEEQGSFRCFGSVIENGEFEWAYYYFENFFDYMPALLNLDYFWEPMQLKDIEDDRNPYYEKPEEPDAQLQRELAEIREKKYQNQYEVNKAIEEYLEKAGEDVQFSPEDILFVQRYTGYGGLSDYMDAEKEADLIRGTLYEYYTPEPLVKKMWGLAYKHGFKPTGTVLEPSCGTGRFIKFAPDQSQVKAYELSKVSSRIANLCFPKAQVVNDYFESEFFTGYGKRQMNKKYEGTYDLVIGNVPFGDYAGKYASMGEKKYSHAGSIDSHFLVRGLDALKPGGLLILIVSSRFMQGEHKEVKAEIQKRGNLIDAFRLWAGVFQKSDVMADIIIIRKVGGESGESRGRVEIKESRIIPHITPSQAREQLKSNKGQRLVNAFIDEYIKIYPTIKNLGFHIDTIESAIIRCCKKIDMPQDQCNEYTGANFDKFIRLLVESDLPSRSFPEKIKIESSLYPGEYNIKPRKTRIKSFMDTEKDKFECLRKIPIYHQLRPSISGVYYDNEHKNMVATDAHVLTNIKHEVTEEKLRDAKTGAKISGNFPRYTSVIPTDPIYRHNVDLENMVQRVAGLVHTAKFFDTPVKAEIIYMTNGDKWYFNPHKLMKSIRPFVEFGYKNVFLELPNSVTRAVVFRSEDEKILSLVMPMQYLSQYMTCTIEKIQKSK